MHCGLMFKMSTLCNLHFFFNHYVDHNHNVDSENLDSVNWLCGREFKHPVVDGFEDYRVKQVQLFDSRYSTYINCLSV